MAEADVTDSVAALPLVETASLIAATIVNPRVPPIYTKVVLDERSLHVE